MAEVMEKQMVLFDAAPEIYRHWKLKVDGRVATLLMDVNEDAGLRPGYKLKLNSYDLGVDIELHDALQRIRFEHPEVACVVISSAKERMFCAGANIYMLGLSSHASANSYPPPAVVPFSAARNFSPSARLESSIPFRVSFVNLQKFTFQPCDESPSM